MQFKNEYDSSIETSFLDLLKWKLFHRAKKKPELSTIGTVNNRVKLQTEDDFICWLGHASFLIQLEGFRFIIDPVFGNIPFYKRYSESPYNVQELGKINYLLISHLHYDHFDRKSINALRKQHPKFILPQGMQNYISDNEDIQTLQWYETYEINSKLSVTFVPAKHWGQRGLFDRNKALWGGFILQSPAHTFFFAGDSGYDKHFKTIGKQFDIDYALLPIGAYEPNFFMKSHHLSPQEAHQAFKDLQATKMIPMHYGTFQLSNESINAPKQWIKKIKEQEPNIIMLDLGEVYRV
jgi:L-ascorbate metabolism protein UlaG (beta-lactamase superfamily)